MPTESAEQLRQALRAEMPVADRYVYFDHAAVGPLTRPAADAIRHWLDQAVNQGDAEWPAWARGVEKTRATAAKLIGASRNEIALVPSTTAGINFVAEGLDWRDGDNVVTLADEFPSNLYPWIHQRDHGVEVRMVETDNGKVDLAKLRDACDSRTRVVSVSWVGFLTGYRQPIEAISDIAHQAGAWFFLDAIQGTGVFPIDVKQLGIDCLAADGHKWMLGPEGAGLAYIRSDCLDQLRAIGVGWNSVVGRFDYSTVDLTLRREAARYEGGTTNMVGMLALGASLELLTRQPTEVVAESILGITDYACERLGSIGARIVSHREIEPDGHDPRSGIVSFEMPSQDPIKARQRCLDADIVLSCRGGRLRLAAHAYNTTEDVDRLVETLGR